jgi:MarC family membrane protein
MWELYAGFFGTVVIALNPIGNVSFFLGVTAGKTAEEKSHMANVVFITVCITMVVTILLGQKILALFGIEIGAFRIGAGIVLFLLGLDMVREGAGAPPSELETGESHDITIVPLAIPLVAGPAMFGAVIAKTENLTGYLDEIIFCALGIAAVFIIWLSHKFASTIARYLGEKGLDVLTRLVGLILIGMAIQAMGEGIRNFFPSMMS